MKTKMKALYLARFNCTTSWQDVETTLDMGIPAAAEAVLSLNFNPAWPTDGHRFVHRPVTKHHVGQVSRETRRESTIYIYVCVRMYVCVYSMERARIIIACDTGDAMVMAGVTLQMDCRAIV